MRARFPTAHSLFEVFPELQRSVTLAPGDDAPVAYLNKLAALQKFDEAVPFCAHWLPRREAVWWACGSARLLLDELAEDDANALIAAENWVRDPTEQQRLVAARIGGQGDKNKAVNWLAMAAGWSGGLLHASRDNPVPTPHYLTPRAAAVAVTLASLKRWPQQRMELLATCISEGIALAESGL